MENPKRKVLESESRDTESVHIRYSTRRIRRKQEEARQRFFSEPYSYADAIERGLNYYWDNGE